MFVSRFVCILYASIYVYFVRECISGLCVSACAVSAQVYVCCVCVCDATFADVGNVWVSFMTDEDVGTSHPQWVANAEVKVMKGKLTHGRVEFDVAQRTLVGPICSLWAGLSSFLNTSYVLFGHDGHAHRLGPLGELLLRPRMLYNSPGTAVRYWQ